jgi:hypothetical protein
VKKLIGLLKFILINVMILVVIVGVPTYFFSSYYNHLGMVSTADNGNGVTLVSTMNSVVNLIEKLGNSTDVINLVNNYTELLHTRNTDLLNVFISVASLLGISVITIGIILNKFGKKFISWTFISSGVISILIYCYMYYIFHRL